MAAPSRSASEFRDAPTRHRLLRVGALVAAAALVGASLIGAILPALLLAGTSTTTVANTINAPAAALPEFILPQENRLLAADGTLLATFYEQNRTSVPLSTVSPVAVQAILAVEDAHFYQHHGLDYQGILRALVANQQRGGIAQGASTITQQYVKNVKLLAARTPEERAAAIAQTSERKLREAAQALELEHHRTKRQILEGYLNIAYFGQGAYGIEAAAWHYFGVHAGALQAHQAALLAGLVKNPSGYDPVRHPQAARERRDVALGRMLDAGVISPEERTRLTALELGLHIQPQRNGCITSSVPFFCDWVRELLLADPALGTTSQARAARLAQGGLTVHTTLNPLAQTAAQHALHRVPPTSRVAAAAVVIQPGTGAVRAMALNRGYGNGPGQTHLPLAVTPAFQPGSTFKMFTLIAALEAGISPDLQLNAPDYYTSNVFDNPPSGAYQNSADGEGGNLTLAQATWHSVNTYYVQLLERVGVHAAAEVARRMGITSIPRTGPRAPGRREGSFTLGTREVSPLELASAYSVLAARGIRCTPYAIESIKDATGNDLRERHQRCTRVLDAQIADTATSILQGVVLQGTGVAAQIGRPVAGKTGTTQSFGAAWFVGYTPQLAASVWLGDPRGPTFPLTDVLGQSRIYGGGIPAEIWSGMMRGALAHTPKEEFTLPPIRDPGSSSSTQVTANPVRRSTPSTGVHNRRRR